MLLSMAALKRILILTIMWFAVVQLVACGVAIPAPTATMTIMPTSTLVISTSTELPSTSPSTFTPILAYLPTLTPIANSTPVGMGAYFDVPSDVLGPRYEIENAYYFDKPETGERYEFYAGAIAGSGDDDTAQGVLILQIMRVADRDGVPYGELVETREYLTENKVGPLRVDGSDYLGGETSIQLYTSLYFIWRYFPQYDEMSPAKIPPLARLELDSNRQLAERGSFCWQGGCADGPTISTSAKPLVTQSPIIAHLHLPLKEPPYSLGLYVMFVSPPGILQDDFPYDYIHEDDASWSYEKPGRERLYLGAFPLKSDQDIKLSFEPGYYVLIVRAFWHDYGDVEYGFLIEIQE